MMTEERSKEAVPVPAVEEERMHSAASNGTSSDVRHTQTPRYINIALRCALKNNVDRFRKCFEDEEDPFFDTVTDMLNEKDDSGKSPMDIAALLGSSGMLKELIERGAEVDGPTSKGYSTLHHAAAWGKVDSLKLLVDNGADLQRRTANNERAREIAARYAHPECVDYLDWAEAKQEFVMTVQTMKETLADPEKVQGRLSREDKNVTNNICREKEDWLENTPDATTQDFISQKQEFEDAVSHIWQKLMEQLPEKPEKK